VQRLLDGMQISLPSLRNRPEDIPAYLARFAGNFARTRGQRPGWSPGALELLNSYPWPGEVRELQAVAHLILTEAVERLEDNPTAPFEIGESDVHAVLAARVQALGGSVKNRQAPIKPTPASAPLKPSRALTREDLIEALAQHGGNIERAARALGIVRNTLKAKLRQFGLRETP